MVESRVKSARGPSGPQQQEGRETGTSLFYAAGAFLTLTALAYRLLFPSLGGGLLENGISHILFFAGFAAILASGARRGEPPFRVTLATGAFALYVLAAIIASKSSNNFRAAFEPGMMLVALWCLFAAANGRVLGHDDAPRAAGILVSLVAVVAAVGAYQRFYEFDAMLEELKTIQLPGYVAGIYIDAKSVEDFRTRIVSREVFATLLTSNVLAGLLALTMPVTLGLLAAIVKGSAGKSAKAAGAAVCAAFVAAQAALVYWTKSKGGLAAMGVGLLVFFLIALYRTVSRKKFAAIVSALVIAAVIVAFAAFPRAKQSYYEARTSMRVRLGYWSATWRMIKSEPLLGVGLGSFPEQYVTFKDMTEREVQNPHNAYLLVWAETGVFTLIFFVALWVLVFAGPRGTGGSARAPSRRLVIGAILAAAALYLLMQGPGAFSGRIPSATAYAAGAIVAAGAAAILWPALAGADVGLARAGLAGGIAGFLASSAVDVTFSDAPAAAAAVFAAAAYAPRGKAAALAVGNVQHAHPGRGCGARACRVRRRELRPRDPGAGGHGGRAALRHPGRPRARGEPRARRDGARSDKRPAGVPARLHL